MQIGSGIVSDGGPFHTELSGIPSSSAAVSVNSLNVLPAWRRDWVARLNAMLRWPGAATAIARIAPVPGVIATTAAAGSPGLPSQLPIAFVASRCSRGSSVVVTFIPPCSAPRRPYRCAGGGTTDAQKVGPEALRNRVLGYR